MIIKNCKVGMLVISDNNHFIYEITEVFSEYVSVKVHGCIGGGYRGQHTTFNEIHPSTFKYYDVITEEGKQ